MHAMTIPDEAVWGGVATLLDDYVEVRDEDLVFILYTADAREPAAWIATALALRGIKPRSLGMNPIKDDTLEARLRAVLPPPEGLSSRMVLLTVERDSMSHVAQLRSALSPYNESDWAVFRLISASADYFRQSMNVTPQLLSGVNAGLLERMMPASRLHITSSSGTDLEAEIDSSRYRWVSNRGVRREGGFVILPPGEVATFPANINGTLVADGAFNVNTYTAADVRLARRPVTLRVENGRVVTATCTDPDVMRLLTRCMALDNGDRIGELGFGTNVGTTEFIPLNSHINERHPGLHLGLGHHNQLREVVEYPCDIHLDLITSDMTVTVDGHTRISSTDLERFADSVHPTPLPAVLHDEDLDGDCCGLFAGGDDHKGAEVLRMGRC